MAQKNGFTLAEVLLTLAVIGIVSSMVIPAVMNNVQNAGLATSWRKTYSDVEQATKLMLNDNGGTFEGLQFIICESDKEPTRQIMYKYQSYYNSSKLVITSNVNCGNLYSTLATLYKNSDGRSVIKNADGNYANLTNWTGNAIVLANGSYVIYLSGNTKCGGDYNWIPADHKTLGKNCASMLVDVNGSKSPNMIGKDVFEILINERGIYPQGVNSTTLQLYSCDKTGSYPVGNMGSHTNDFACGASILANPDFKVPF